MLIRELDFLYPVAVYAGGDQDGAAELFTAVEITELHAAGFAEVRVANGGFDAGYYYVMARAQGEIDGRWWASMVLVYAVDGDRPVTIVKKGTGTAKYFRPIGEFDAVRDIDVAQNKQLKSEDSRAELAETQRLKGEAIDAGVTLWATDDSEYGARFPVSIYDQASPEHLPIVMVLRDSEPGGPRPGPFYLQPFDSEQREPSMDAAPAPFDIYRTEKLESERELAVALKSGRRKPCARWTIGSHADICGKDAE